MREDAALLDLLRLVRRFGVAVVSGTPADNASSRQVVMMFMSVSYYIFGVAVVSGTPADNASSRQVAERVTLNPKP